MMPGEDTLCVWVGVGVWVHDWRQEVGGQGNGVGGMVLGKVRTEGATHSASGWVGVVVRGKEG